MNVLNVTLRTPTEVLFSGEAEVVRLKTDLGRMEILPNHTTIVGTILYSKVFIRSGATEEKFVIRQGSVSVNDAGKVHILANQGHQEASVTIESMEEYLNFLAEQISSGSLNEYQVQFMEEQRAALQEGLQETE